MVNYLGNMVLDALLNNTIYRHCRWQTMTYYTMLGNSLSLLQIRVVDSKDDEKKWTT